MDGKNEHLSLRHADKKQLMALEIILTNGCQHTDSKQGLWIENRFFTRDIDNMGMFLDMLDGNIDQQLRNKKGL